MSIYEHNRRTNIITGRQHLYRHSISDFAYTNDALPGVSNLEGAFNYLVAVLYPQSQPAVANVAALPAAGNTINDMRVVSDDGDGKAAAYRWEQREGDAVAKWYKIYDLDWGTDSILQGFLLKTQDLYVHKHGYNDLDSTGTLLVGINAGQHIYGGAAANSHLTLHANSGDGVGAQTGFVQVADEFRPQVDSTWSLGTTSERWLKVWTDEATVSTMTIVGGSITDTSGAIAFGDEALSTTGNITGASVIGTVSGVFAADITITSGSIVSASGALSFGNENVSTTGTTAASSGIFGSLTVTSGSITDTSGSITFVDENLLTTGTLGAGITTVTQLNVDDLRLDGNTLNVQTLNTNLELAANGTGVINLGSAATTGNVTATGTVGVTGILDIDNLRLDGNTLSSTSVDGNIVLDPNGLGLLELGSGYYPTADSSEDIGKTGNRWNDIWFDGSLQDGTTAITSTVLQSLRDINAGPVAVGDAIFWTGTKWESSNPDSEITHADLNALGTDDHTQYLLLAGRAGGQSAIGGTAASDNLTLESTSNATKGKVLSKDELGPFTTANYTTSWQGTDLGSPANLWRHVYSKGEFFGFRLENLGADPGASVQNVGRLFWNTAEGSVKVDTGTAIVTVGGSTFESDTVWDGIITVLNVDTSATVGMDARKAVWQLKNNAADFEVMHVSLKATSATNLRITVNLPLPAGTYRLNGVQ